MDTKNRVLEVSIDKNQFDSRSLQIELRFVTDGVYFSEEIPVKEKSMAAATK